MKNQFIFTTAFMMLSMSFNITVANDAPAVSMLNKGTIQIHKENVIKELKKNYYIKCGIGLTCAALTIYSLYKIYFPSVEQAALIAYLESKAQGIKQSDFAQNKEQLFHNMLVEEKKIIQEMRIDLARESIVRQQLEEKLREAGVSLRAPSWFDWCKGQAGNIVKNSLVISAANLVLGGMSPFSKYLRVLNSSIDRLIDKTFFSVDLNWYLLTHTMIFDILNQAQTHANALVVTDNSDSFAYDYNSLVGSLSLIIEQLELTLGFMAYKADILEQTSFINAKRARDLSDRIFNHINSSVLDIQFLFSQMRLEHSSGHDLATKINEMNQFIQESFHRFSSIEFVSGA